MKKSITATILPLIFSLFFGAMAFGSEGPTDLFENLSNFEPSLGEPLRGPDIGALAGNCDVGPFGKVGDRGEYDKLCSQLTKTEKCFAYLKQHIEPNGQSRNAADSAKAVFCMNIISKGLTSQSY